MTDDSTTIRVSRDQRDRLRRLADERNSTMAATLDAALESLRRQRFWEDMAAAQYRLHTDPVAWETYVRERDAWLNSDAAAS